MSYLIQQILLCLLIAAIIGFVVGWLLRGISARQHEQDQAKEFEQRLRELKRRTASRQSTQTSAALHTAPDAASLLDVDSAAHIDDYYIEAIEGIGQGRGKILREMGVSMVQEFLQKYRRADDRRTELATKLDIDEHVVRQWVSMADLMRIQGIGSQYSELLEASGVYSVPELAQQDAERLTEKMKLVNRVEHATILALPDASEVSAWIEIAKSLPSIITV
jgi:predicted flap endonuclease-1-like 5' DNA nuclease